MTEPITGFHGEYRWLSNCWPSLLVINWKEYDTVEHAYQAFKMTNLEDHEFVRNSLSPGAAKRAARRRTMMPDWEETKLKVMTDLVTMKFSNINELGKALLDTGDAELIEGNTWGDTFWGVCNGVGRNELGKILMGVREKLRAEQEKNSTKQP